MHILGDSKCVFDWLKGEARLEVLHLEAWKLRIREIISKFRAISFQQIYREFNSTTDILSKRALELELGLSIFDGFIDNKIQSSFTISIDHLRAQHI